MSGLLIINRFDSRCGECGKSADPDAKSHAILLGYGPTNGDPGCGVVWDRVASDYARMREACARKRPDLEWAGWEGA